MDNKHKTNDEANDIKQYFNIPEYETYQSLKNYPQDMYNDDITTGFLMARGCILDVWKVMC